MTEENNHEESSKPKRNSNGHYYGRALPAVMVIFVGFLFLLQSFGVFHGDVWGKLWPFFIIIPGIFMLLQIGRKRD